VEKKGILRDIPGDNRRQLRVFRLRVAIPLRVRVRVEEGIPLRVRVRVEEVIPLRVKEGIRLRVKEVIPLRVKEGIRLKDRDNRGIRHKGKWLRTPILLKVLSLAGPESTTNK
jgi:hypothetical protein